MSMMALVLCLPEDSVRTAVTETGYTQAGVSEGWQVQVSTPPTSPESPGQGMDARTCLVFPVQLQRNI